jgi:hypothetical protein
VTLFNGFLVMSFFERIGIIVVFLWLICMLLFCELW